MRTFTPAIAASWSLAGLLLVTGCTKRSTPVEDGIRTHTLLVGNQNEPASLDPHILDAYTDMRIAIALFEGLTVLDEKTARPLPGTAERWDVSPDGLTYTFQLRPTARWSNGDRVTAGDFAFAFQRILTPSLGSSYAYMLYPLKNAEAFNAGKLTDFSAVGVRAIDDQTLQLTLTLPTPYLLSLVAHSTWYPVHRAAIEKHGKIDARDSAWTRPGNLVGNGPFVLAEWRPNARISVTKNPYYWDAAHNSLERVTFFPIENAVSEELSFRAGQLHLTESLPPAKIALYQQESPEILRLNRLLSVLYLNFNTTKPPFDNVKVRQALSRAFDRAALAQRVYTGTAKPAGTFVPAACGDYVGPRGLPDDFAAARTLLAEAGFPNGAGFPTVTLEVFNDDKMPRLGEAIQSMWLKELGVHINIMAFEQKTGFQNQRSLAHQLAVCAWTGDYVDALTFLGTLASRSGNNWTGWKNPAFDAALDEAAATADAAKRLLVLQRAEEILLRECPVAPLTHPSQAFLVHRAVRHLELSPLGLCRYQRLELTD